MPRKREKRLKTWTESDLARAIAETKQGKSVNSVAIKYGMDEGTLRYRIKKENNGELITRSGRKPVMDADTEQTLVKSLEPFAKFVSVLLSKSYCKSLVIISKPTI